jgi:hypothetical protein
LLAIVFLQAITGAYTPACLSAAYDPVETVTPPLVCLSNGNSLQRNMMEPSAGP